MKYDLKANEDNLKIFKRYFLIDNNSKVFTCVLCNKKTSISGSTSIMGYKLICTECVYNKFDGDYSYARKWQNINEVIK